MTTVFADLSVSLEGFVAGPDPSLQDPLGAGGEQLHEWALAAAAWREAHGREGGERGVDSELVAETVGRTGAGIMGRRMFSGGSGPWEDDPNARGWWGEDPPFHHTVFVLTSHARQPLEMQGGTTFVFVTDGIESALAQAREAAGGKDVQIHGGGSAVQQAIAAGVLDELQVHVAPLLLGAGTPLLGGSTGRLERVRVLESPRGVTHVRYRVLK
jgi:dihydrofolate reductase